MYKLFRRFGRCTAFPPWRHVACRRASGDAHFPPRSDRPLSSSKVRPSARTHAVALTHARIFPHDAARTHARMRIRYIYKKKKNPDRRRPGPRWDSVGRHAAIRARALFPRSRYGPAVDSTVVKCPTSLCIYIYISSLSREQVASVCPG